MESFTGLMGCWLGCAHTQGADAEMDSNVLFFLLFLALSLCFILIASFIRAIYPSFCVAPLAVLLSVCTPNHTPFASRLLPTFFSSPLSSAGAVRASSIFPILSVILLFMGGLCIAASEFYKSRHNIILSAGIFFVSAGELNSHYKQAANKL